MKAGQIVSYAGRIVVHEWRSILLCTVLGVLMTYGSVWTLTSLLSVGTIKWNWQPEGWKPAAEWRGRTAETPTDWTRTRSWFGTMDDAGWGSGPKYSRYERTLVVGWPFRALYATSVETPKGRRSVGMLELQWNGRKVSMPWLPRWRGFVANTCLFACSAGVLLWGIRIWRTRRAAIGHCSTCGYDKRGLPEQSPCPECGKSTSAGGPQRRELPRPE